MTALQACLNGTRRTDEHAAVPVTADDLALAAHAAVAAGATSLHIHPRDATGEETLDAQPVAAALTAIRNQVAVPVGVTTGAWIEPDPARRLALVGRWTALPDFASVNLVEPGAVELGEVLLERGVAIEAGLWSEEDAVRLVESTLAARCLRLLLEPGDLDHRSALATTGAIAAVLDAARVVTPRLLHGLDATAWSVLDAAVERGDDTRIGLEDVLVLPDGSLAPDNAALVEAAKRRL